MAILEVTQRGAVSHLTMNAPERLNALSDEMLAALQETLDGLAEDASNVSGTSVVLSAERSLPVVLAVSSPVLFCLGWMLAIIAEVETVPAEALLAGVSFVVTDTEAPPGAFSGNLATAAAIT